MGAISQSKNLPDHRSLLKTDGQVEKAFVRKPLKDWIHRSNALSKLHFLRPRR
jgi:hypothetical protein